MTGGGWLVLGGSAAAVVAALIFVPPEWLAAADERLAAWRAWLGGARAAAIVAAWVWWNGLVARVPGLNAEAVAYLRGRRHFWGGALLAVELVLVRNVPGALWRLAA